VGGAAHASEAGGVGAAYGLVFERIGEPASLVYEGTVHEIVESILDPYFSPSSNGGWGWNPEACAGCAPATTINGVKVCGMDGGREHRQGGACTTTGYISWPF
ncbi:MAG: hypothetical protein M3O46_09280, partial [Myxococcota bacterium]|nr:hypothetical protein [Myxococcota bacterium]